MDPVEQARRQVTQALARIVAKGLAADSPARFSVRIPGRNAMATGNAQANLAEIAIIPLDQPGVSEPALTMHAAVYRIRGDAGAILTAQQPWASRLALLTDPMPAVFDEQARQLGRRIDRLSQKGPQLTAAGATRLKRGAHAFELDEGVLTIGFTAERAVLNAELLEKCAKAYLLACLTGHRIGRIPWLVRYIAVGRLRKDQRRASESYARGEMPGSFSTY